jgi:electron transport complex protein RnfB
MIPVETTLNTWKWDMPRPGVELIATDLRGQVSSKVSKEEAA